MKKTLLFISLLLTMSTASMAQVDTIDIGERVPNFYYWDTNWWDHYYLNYTSPSNHSFLLNDSIVYLDTVNFLWGSRRSNCKLENARYIYTDVPLTVIGIAGLVTITNRMPADSLKFPEYFRLYEVGDKTNNDSMILLAETRWDNNPVRRLMIAEIKYDYARTRKDFLPLYEAYFDTAIVVNDSFYISCTSNNSFRYADEDSTEYYEPLCDCYLKYLAIHDNYPKAGITFTGALLEDQEFMHPKPPLTKVRAHFFDSIAAPYFVLNNIDQHYTDTNWHTTDLMAFINIFPIFDTCTHCNPGNDTCIAPSDLRASVSQYDTGSTTLTWGYIDRAINYEVSLCKDSCLPDNGTILQSATTFLNIENLDTAQWYTVWVRSVCENDKTSPWSDSVRFYIPGKASQGTEDIQSTLDRFTILMPNPASDIVTVLSSFTILSIDIFTLNGQSVAHQGKINAITTAFPLDNLPKGTYIVRIVTPHGTSHKKLVIN
ncbi:MAG: T9SS type A sorting domain-containing protein [Bacteroidales bacterium]|nr:T9SS type A sorting domain-containing protein [Bacteroidales bacterium]